jgi:hypothetical protein
VPDDCAVPTSVTRAAEREEETESRAVVATVDPKAARAEWLWPVFGLALLGVFLSFVVDDYPLRTLIAGN